MNTKLNVTSETGDKITIDVIDIFNNEKEGKEYILYTIDNDIYASLLEETKDTFMLKTITSDEDMELIKKRINELVS